MQVEDLKATKESQDNRDKELNKLRAESMLDMANMVAFYVSEQAQNKEDDQDHDEKVSSLYPG